MSASVTGIEDILKNIEAKLGKTRATRVNNKALRNYSEELKQDVETAVSSYIDTGETHDTVIASGIKKGPPEVKINNIKCEEKLIYLQYILYVI